MNPFNINNIIRPNVKAMKAYSSARDEFQDINDNYIFLDANENPFPSPYNRYPDPQQRALKQVLSDKHGVGKEQLVLGNGSDEVLDLLFRAFCNPGIDNVIGISPSYGMYQVLANLNDVEYRKSLLKPEVFSLDVNDILSKVDEQTKLIFLCSPNNPTGQFLDEKDIELLLKSFNGLVVVDEAYIDFGNRDSWNKRLNLYPNLVVIQTLSKAYGLAGLRLGILFANEEVISILNKIKPPYNINQFTQDFAQKCIIDKTYNESLINLLSKERVFLFELLLEVDFVKKVYPSDSNFILIKVDNANKRYQQLIEKGIVIRNRTNDDLCENFLRITVGTEEENQKLIQTLKTI